MISCCGSSAAGTQGFPSGTSQQDSSGGISLFGSANCGLCMKCLLFWVLIGVLILVLIRGRD